MRKAEYALMCGLPPPATRFQGRPMDDGPHDVSLVGAAASGGAAEGRVYRVPHGHELSDLPAGSVLVVPACDVGLCAVLPAVRAVVSEQGGVTSHGTMLASALGVPVVVGVSGALSRLRDGERVRVDAERAHVERLGSAV
jgi:pyruvate,water dikinase